MRFERHTDPRETLNIGRIKEAYRASYIRAAVQGFPFYYYGPSKVSTSPATISAGIVFTEEKFIRQIQEGNTKELRRYLIARAKEQIERDLESNHYTTDPQKPPHYSFRNMNYSDNGIWICQSPDDELPIEGIFRKDLVYRGKFYRFPEGGAE